jgi:hypothetical protein
MYRSNRSKPCWVSVVSFVMTSAAVGCTASSDTPTVQYGSSQPIGRWAADYAGKSGEAAPAAGAAAAAGSNAVAPVPVVVDAGRAADAGTTTAPDAGASVSADSGASVNNGNPTSMDPNSGTNSVTSLAFDVTTSAVGYRYQPKNIGAIWVQDSSGKLVKSLEVWAATRRRYLTRYVSELSGSAVDVTASATLPSHRTHHATWNLKDKSGATVPPGQYTLVIELTDGDQTGRNDTVSFDTSAGPTTLTPANAPSFSSMKLQLQ